MSDARVRRAKPALALSPEPLERGRACFARNEWDDAFRALSIANAETPLEVEDLDRLAWSAGLTARDEEMLSTLERVYNVRLEAREDLAAARTAFWLGFRLLARGEPGRASGWLGRAQRLVEREGRECVEQGYLLLPVGQRHLNAGEFVEAHDAAARAAEFGERFSEADLSAFARNLQGRALLAGGQLERGLALMDEAMVAATSGELSPVVTGIIYCSAIASCQRVYALDRAREWTVALTAWCEKQPQLGMFTAYCHVHRAEVMQLSGYWPESVAEARRAVALCVREIERDAAGRAHYQHGEIHRLRGEFVEAETAYRDASRSGIEPQPGLALLRLAQGDKDAAATSIRRIVAATSGRLPRTRFLPAYVEILLAAGDLQEANAASRELEQVALDCGLEVLAAIAAHAVAAVRLAEGNPAATLDPARRAFVIWQGVGAPYLAARIPLVLRFVFHRLLTIRTPLGRKVRPKMLARGGPLIRVKPVDLAAAGVQRVPRVVGAHDGRPLLADGRTLNVANVIWCSGYHPGFDWIDLPIFAAEGTLLHQGGVVEKAPGLYCVGLTFLYAMSSSMIHGVSRDAERIVKTIEAHRATVRAAAAMARMPVTAMW